MTIRIVLRKRLYLQGCKANGLHHASCDGVANSLHHIRPVSLYGSDDESNLLPVNRLCHDLIHNPKNEKEAVDLGLLILDVSNEHLSIDAAIVKRHKDAINAAKERLRESLN